MTVTVKPSRATGTVASPPSKSMAHRALICGALSKKSVVTNIDFSKDIIATLNCLEKLGAKVEIHSNAVTIGGLKLDAIPDNVELDADESGSTLRFLIPLCMAAKKTVILKGAKRLFERPLDIYESIAKKQNILFQKSESSLIVCGNILSGEYSVEGNVSSQFISGLLFLLPLFKGDSTLTVTGNFESASYVDLTLQVLNTFGVDIKQKNNTFYIKGCSEYKSQNYVVEGDCSNAAFLEAFNYLGGNVTVEGLNKNTLQGDRVYKNIFEGLKNGKKQFCLSDCPDLAPVVFAVSTLYGGAEFTGTKRLKIKESDRAEAMKQELSKFGMVAEVYENSVIIKDGELRKPTEVLNSHNDHRIAMALTLL
ncbi:MAG: 3-phosphoshikimate 1-carboxyvinyltransferase [Clostridia bacterium]|nr:3-phosphoshikimate 1-carboxyvinyltransferase [Clostridia bacterium]